MTQKTPSRSGSRSGRKSLVAERRYPKTRGTSAKAKSSGPAKRKKAKRRPARSGQRRGLLGWILALPRLLMRLIWAVSWRSAVLGGILIGGAALMVAANLPAASEQVDGRARGSVTMYDRYGDIYAWRGDQFGGMITTDMVSPHIVNAVVATEDKRFRRHWGISPRGMASAIRINLSEGRGPLSGHGGSTLTQQTAKLLCLGVPFNPSEWDSEAAYEADCRRTTVWRKVKEAIYSLGMEIKYSKEEILSIYLNRAFLGAGARGFEAAMGRYFGKSASEATVQEAAMLAGLLVAPTRYAPTNNLERSQARAATVIRLMEEQGYLSQGEAQAAWNKPATLSKAAKQEAGGYFADWVLSDLNSKNLPFAERADMLLATTLDPRIQAAAENALSFVFETKVSASSTAEAAIVVMSADGAVRGMVGGRESKVTGAFNRATMAKRQTGSTFKPFVYATAMELGYSPNDTVVDEPTTFDVPGSGPYSPRNFTEDFAGRVTLTEALARSINVPAVKISEGLGRDLVMRVAEDFGIKSDLANGPALALGASESTLLEMTGAYAGILNGGSAVTPYGLTEIRFQGQEAPLSGRTGGIRERVITQEAAGKLVYMMHQVVEAGSGRRAQIPGFEIAGKTGTTQGARDAWFIGFTSDYVVGVWMGNDDNRPLRGVTGSGLPADIWRETVNRVHGSVPPAPLPMVRPARRAPAASAPQPQAQPQARAPQPAPQSGEGLILGILQQILGGN